MRVRWLRRSVVVLARRFIPAVTLLLLLTGCADLATGPHVEDPSSAAETGPAFGCDLMVDGVYIMCPVNPTVPGPGECDPWTSVNWCGGGDCMMSTAELDFQGINGCLPPPPGGGGTPTCPTWDPTCSPAGGSGDGGGVPTPPTYEGPGAFAACVGGLLVLMGTTAIMEPFAHALYDARNNYDSARRMYAAVMANNPTLEMELLYEHRVDVAKAGYDSAVGDYASTAGASVLAVIGAVVLCSPGLLLPTP
jgi:hypothetical protein